MSKLAIKATSKFKKDYKAAIKRGLDISLLEAIIKKLANQEPLPLKIETINYIYSPSLGGEFSFI